MAHEVAVMYLGRLVERARTKALFGNPLHPYTKALFSAALPSHPDVEREESILSGEVPSPINPPRGYRFHPRCPAVMPRCAEREPELRGEGMRGVEESCRAPGARQWVQTPCTHVPPWRRHSHGWPGGIVSGSAQIPSGVQLTRAIA
jgi:oligopeptide/dipeptide ABC transporter ATP-binding protein